MRGKVIAARIRRVGEGTVFSSFVSPHPGGCLPGAGVPTLVRGHKPWSGGGVPTLARVGTYLGWGGGAVPTLGRVGVTYPGRGYLSWARGYLPWLGGISLGGGRVPTLDRGVPTLDRLCHGQYASCGFPQEDFLVFSIFCLFVWESYPMVHHGRQEGGPPQISWTE